MNLDNLISKYIDGELSHSEDKRLRELISKDVVAKQVFDAHVLIHAAFKEDASRIVPSDELVSKTEDKVLSKILTNQPFVDDTVSEKKSRRVFAYASFVVVVLLTAVISISDFSINKSGNQLSDALANDRIKILQDNETTISQAEKVPENLVMILPNENSAHRINNRINKSIALPQNIITSGRGTSSSGSVLASSVSLSGSTTSLLTEKIGKVFLDNQIETTDIVYNDRFTLSPNEHSSNEDLLKLNETSANDNVSPIESTTPTNFLSIQNNLINNASRTQLNQNMVVPDMANVLGNTNNYYFYGKRSEVQLNTFLGSNVLQKGYGDNTPKIVSEFSQSIAYHVSQNQFIGMDFGLTKYSYDQTENVVLPGIVNKSEGSKGNAGVEIRGTSSGSGFITFPIKINIQQQMFWGAVFFDQGIFSSDKFTLNGRLALGATNEGPLGYMRIYGKYRVFNWLSINAGADSRMFKWNEPVFGAAAGSYKSSLSIIYGFEIKI